MKRFRLDDTEDHVSDDGIANGTKLVPAGSVLLLARGMTLLNDLPICVISRPMTFNQDVKALRPKPDVRSDYLPYLLLGNKGRLLSLVDLAGHGTGRLNSDELKALDVALPPLPEQRAIAHILGTLDDKIELNRRMSETLEAMARALFQSWFIDFDPVRRNAARARNQPSPPSPLPEGEGRSAHYRGGYDFSGLLETARELRRKQTPAEDLFWELVRGRRFMRIKFRRQHQVGDYIVDFYCHEHRLVVELDGGVHSVKREKDHRRDAWMQAQGYTVLRFPNEQLLNDPQAVFSAIAHVVEPSSQLPPLPLGEGRGEGMVESSAFDHLFPARLVDSELGEIPEGWKVKPLPELIEVNPARALRKGEVAPYLDMANMPTRAHSPDSVIDRPFGSGMRFVNGDTLVARITPCLENGKTAFVDFLTDGQVGWGSTEYIVLRPKPPLPVEFAYCLARSDGFRDFAIQSMTGSSGRQRVPAESLAHLWLVDAHRRVAEVFGRLVQPLFTRAGADQRIRYPRRPARRTPAQAHLRRAAGEGCRAVRGKDDLMAEINLTQAEADAPIAMAKHRVDGTVWDYPDLGGTISIPPVSADRREQFALDLSRGRIDLAKGTYRNRGRQVVVLGSI